MTGEYRKYSKKSNELQSYKIPWRLLSKEEKEDIMNNAKKKKEELLRLENLKKAEIISGRQRTMENCWE